MHVAPFFPYLWSASHATASSSLPKDAASAHARSSSPTPSSPTARRAAIPPRSQSSAHSSAPSARRAVCVCVCVMGGHQRKREGRWTMETGMHVHVPGTKSAGSCSAASHDVCWSSRRGAAAVPAAAESSGRGGASAGGVRRACGPSSVTLPTAAAGPASRASSAMAGPPACACCLRSLGVCLFEKRIGVHVIREMHWRA